MSDRTPLERLADEHARAWSELATSTAQVATLPLRTITGLLGSPWPQLPSAGERARRAEAEAARLATRLAEAHEARRLIELERQREAEQAREVQAELRRAYTHLEDELAQRITQAGEDQKVALYRLLEPLLTQLPVARHAIAEGREVEAGDLLALFAPLDAALAAWGFTPIGEVGQELAFERSQHQVTGGATPEPGTRVRVKQVGYRLGQQILRRAKVSVVRQASER